MEIINKTQSETAAAGSIRKSNTYTVLGIILIAIGALWLLFNYGILSALFFDYLFSWQSLVSVIGIVLLATRRWVAGGVTTAVGAFFLVMDICNVYISFSKVVLPVLIIALGVVCLFVKSDKK